MPTETISDFTQVGRTNAPDPAQPQVSITRNLDFSGAGDFLLDFTTVNQKQVFGIPRTVYVDNGTNPNSVTLTVSITNQTITIAPYSIGYYNVTANDKSTIRFVSDGGASSNIVASVYNYVIPPSVWYSYGTSNPLTGEPVSGTIAEGADVASATSNNPVYIGGIDRATGLFHGVSVNATGVVNTGSPDGANVTQGAITDTAWSGSGNGTIVAILKAMWTAITARNGSLTDQSNTNLSGSSESLMLANSNRRILIINNPNASNSIAVNLSGGTAALNTGGSITIAPGQTIRFDSFAPTGAITVIGTAADDVTAYEG